MKKSAFMVVGLATASLLHAQDTIITKDGESIQAKVYEINQGEIHYKKWSNMDGPIYTIDRNSVSSITYQNGSKEDLAATAPSQPANGSYDDVYAQPGDQQAAAQQQPANNNYYTTYDYYNSPGYSSMSFMLGLPSFYFGIPYYTGFWGYPYYYPYYRPYWSYGYGYRPWIGGGWWAGGYGYGGYGWRHGWGGYHHGYYGYHNGWRNNYGPRGGYGWRGGNGWRSSSPAVSHSGGFSGPRGGGRISSGPRMGGFNSGGFHGGSGGFHGGGGGFHGGGGGFHGGGGHGGGHR